MVRLLPKETKFFDLFEEMSSNLILGATAITDLLRDFQDTAGYVKKIKDIEHRGDEITHTILIKLNSTFITPFDREDIHTLASSLDDVLDFINAAADRIILYKINAAPAAAYEIAQIIVKQSESLARAVRNLEKLKDVLPHCVEVNRLENEADRISREAIGKLFDTEKDPIALIKIKELLEVLETATDKAEDAANVLETVVLKSA
jgi:predicted phosphate transport protein (TIGR00153 family)